MNEIIFNISLVILSLGFILMIIYFTTLFTNKSSPSCPINKCSDNNNNNNNNILEQIYDDRPSITYKKMFKDPSVGFGKGDFDVNDNSETTSFYIKSNK